MQKHFLLTVIFTTSIIFCSAQKKLMEYGFHVGLNRTSIYGNSNFRSITTPLIGYNVGGNFKISTSRNFGFKAILQYEQNTCAYRSLTFDFVSGTGSFLTKGDVTKKFYYLNLPVLAEYTFGHKIKFNADAGLFISAFINNKIIMELQDQPPSNHVTTTKSSSSEYQKPINYGVSFGIGTEIPIQSRVKLVLDLRNNTGIPSIDKNQGSYRSTTKTNSISISTGLVFPF